MQVVDVHLAAVKRLETKKSRLAGWRALVNFLVVTKLKYTMKEKYGLTIFRSKFCWKKGFARPTQICEHFTSARRVQRRARRGGKGFAGKTKKSRLAEWRALVNFLVVSAIWSWRRDSNPRPFDYESNALPTVLRQHGNSIAYFLFFPMFFIEFGF